MNNLINETAARGKLGLFQAMEYIITEEPEIDIDYFEDIDQYEDMEDFIMVFKPLISLGKRIFC
jgi:hypothetical protein